MSILDQVNTNPANPQPAVVAKSEHKRIPMSLPVAKLAVPDIPGYHLHWFLGAARVERAMQAGYEFVDETETILNDKSASFGEGRDMGTRVSMIAGSDLDSEGQAERLYLMKLRNEFWEEDQKSLSRRSENLLETLKVGLPATGADTDNSNRYVGKANHNIFTNAGKRRA
jgi:hypothetical protein